MNFFKRHKKATAETEIRQDYWSYVKRQFKKNRRALVSLYLVAFLVLIALFADFLAYEKPIVAKVDGKWYAPVLKDYGVKLGLTKWEGEQWIGYKWKDETYDFVIWPLIPYSPTNQNTKLGCVGPNEKQAVKSNKWRHWMGTDGLGRDVASGMIHGTRVALSVGIIVMMIASFIGIFLGSFAGFFGDNGFKVSRSRVYLNIPFLFIAWFYAFHIRRFVLVDTFNTSYLSFFWQLLISFMIVGAILAIANLLAGLLKKMPFFAKKVAIPIDMMVSRVIEAKVAIPSLILMLALLAIIEKKSIINVMIILGLLSWTGIARLVRAELLRVRSLEYIEAANALGFSRYRVMFRHALPNSLTPVFINIAFGVASAILAEAVLSFLGIGIPPDKVTWGSLLTDARHNNSAWWLATFPGLAIFLTVSIFNFIGEGLTEALNPRLKK